VDFYAVDREGRPVVVEVKRVQATLNHFDQLTRYVGLFAERAESDASADAATVRGMLVAPSASERVRRACRDAGLEFVALSEFETDATGVTDASLSDFA